jgi:hypothetical protein
VMWSPSGTALILRSGELMTAEKRSKREASFPNRGKSRPYVPAASGLGGPCHRGVRP